MHLDSSSVKNPLGPHGFIVAFLEHVVAKQYCDIVVGQLL
jgi:hypothetical protein